MEQIDEDIAAYLEKAVDEEAKRYREGADDDATPATGMSDRDLIGACAFDIDGTTRMGGQADECFPLESVSKALSLALALEDVGPEELFRHVGKEPTGDRFHSIAPLEEGRKGVPSNPMINAGAIAVTSMIRGRNGEERFDRLLNFLRKLSGNPDIDYNHEMFEAEDKDLNRALFYFMRSHGTVSGTEEESLVPYLKQTSVEMSCRDLARIGAVLANYGRDPESGEQLVGEHNVAIVLTLMFTTGMYDASGTFATDVGLPAKSGISGAIMAVVPGRMGLATIGPTLDNTGNSIAGVRILEKLASRWQLGIFSAHGD